MGREEEGGRAGRWSRASGAGSAVSMAVRGAAGGKPTPARSPAVSSPPLPRPPAASSPLRPAPPPQPPAVSALENLVGGRREEPRDLTPSPQKARGPVPPLESPRSPVPPSSDFSLPFTSLSVLQILPVFLPL